MANSNMRLIHLNIIYLDLPYLTRNDIHMISRLPKIQNALRVFPDNQVLFELHFLKQVAYDELDNGFNPTTSSQESERNNIFLWSFFAQNH